MKSLVFLFSILGLMVVLFCLLAVNRRKPPGSFLDRLISHFLPWIDDLLEIVRSARTSINLRVVSYIQRLEIGKVIFALFAVGVVMVLSLAEWALLSSILNEIFENDPVMFNLFGHSFTRFGIIAMAYCATAFVIGFLFMDALRMHVSAQMNSFIPYTNELIRRIFLAVSIVLALCLCISSMYFAIERHKLMDSGFVGNLDSNPNLPAYENNSQDWFGDLAWASLSSLLTLGNIFMSVGIVIALELLSLVVITAALAIIWVVLWVFWLIISFFAYALKNSVRKEDAGESRTIPAFSNLFSENFEENNAVLGSIPPNKTQSKEE